MKLPAEADPINDKAHRPKRAAEVAVFDSNTFQNNVECHITTQEKTMSQNLFLKMRAL